MYKPPQTEMDLPELPPPPPKRLPGQCFHMNIAILGGSGVGKSLLADRFAAVDNFDRLLRGARSATGDAVFCYSFELARAEPTAAGSSSSSTKTIADGGEGEEERDDCGGCSGGTTARSAAEGSRLNLKNANNVGGMTSARSTAMRSDAPLSAQHQQQHENPFAVDYRRGSIFSGTVTPRSLMASVDGIPHHNGANGGANVVIVPPSLLSSNGDRTDGATPRSSRRSPAMMGRSSSSSSPRKAAAATVTASSSSSAGRGGGVKNAPSNNNNTNGGGAENSNGNNGGGMVVSKIIRKDYVGESVSRLTSREAELVLAAVPEEGVAGGKRTYSRTESLGIRRVHVSVRGCVDAALHRVFLLDTPGDEDRLSIAAGLFERRTLQEGLGGVIIICDPAADERSGEADDEEEEEEADDDSAIDESEGKNAPSPLGATLEGGTKQRTGSLFGRTSSTASAAVDENSSGKPPLTSALLQSRKQSSNQQQRSGSTTSSLHAQQRNSAAGGDKSTIESILDDFERLGLRRPKGLTGRAGAGGDSDDDGPLDIQLSPSTPTLSSFAEAVASHSRSRRGTHAFEDGFLLDGENGVNGAPSRQSKQEKTASSRPRRRRSGSDSSADSSASTGSLLIPRRSNSAAAASTSPRQQQRAGGEQRHLNSSPVREAPSHSSIQNASPMYSNTYSSASQQQRLPNFGAVPSSSTTRPQSVGGRLDLAAVNNAADQQQQQQSLPASAMKFAPYKYQFQQRQQNIHHGSPLTADGRQESAPSPTAGASAGSSPSAGKERGAEARRVNPSFEYIKRRDAEGNVISPRPGGYVYGGGSAAYNPTGYGLTNSSGDLARPSASANAAAAVTPSRSAASAANAVSSPSNASSRRSRSRDAAGGDDNNTARNNNNVDEDLFKVRRAESSRRTGDGYGGGYSSEEDNDDGPLNDTTRTNATANSYVRPPPVTFNSLHCRDPDEDAFGGLSPDAAANFSMASVPPYLLRAMKMLHMCARNEVPAVIFHIGDPSAVDARAAERSAEASKRKRERNAKKKESKTKRGASSRASTASAPATATSPSSPAHQHHQHYSAAAAYEYMLHRYDGVIFRAVTLQSNAERAAAAAAADAAMGGLGAVDANEAHQRAFLMQSRCLVDFVQYIHNFGIALEQQAAESYARRVEDRARLQSRAFSRRLDEAVPRPLAYTYHTDVGAYAEAATTVAVGASPTLLLHGSKSGAAETSLTTTANATEAVSPPPPVVADHALRVRLLGAPASGKTSFLHALVDDHRVTAHIPTDDLDVATCVVELKGRETLKRLLRQRAGLPQPLAATIRSSASVVGRQMSRIGGTSKRKGKTSGRRNLSVTAPAEATATSSSRVGSRGVVATTAPRDSFLAFENSTSLLVGGGRLTPPPPAAAAAGRNASASASLALTAPHSMTATTKGILKTTGGGVTSPSVGPATPPAGGALNVRRVTLQSSSPAAFFGGRGGGDFSPPSPLSRSPRRDSEPSAGGRRKQQRKANGVSSTVGSASGGSRGGSAVVSRPLDAFGLNSRIDTGTAQRSVLSLGLAAGANGGAVTSSSSPTGGVRTAEQSMLLHGSAALGGSLSNFNNFAGNSPSTVTHRRMVTPIRGAGTSISSANANLWDGGAHHHRSVVGGDNKGSSTATRGRTATESTLDAEIARGTPYYGRSTKHVLEQEALQAGAQRTAGASVRLAGLMKGGGNKDPSAAAAAVSSASATNANNNGLASTTPTGLPMDLSAVDQSTLDVVSATAHGCRAAPSGHEDRDILSDALVGAAVDPSRLLKESDAKGKATVEELRERARRHFADGPSAHAAGQVAAIDSGRTVWRDSAAIYSDSPYTSGALPSKNLTHQQQLLVGNSSFGVVKDMPAFLEASCLSADVDGLGEGNSSEEEGGGGNAEGSDKRSSAAMTGANASRITAANDTTAYHYWPRASIVSRSAMGASTAVGPPQQLTAGGIGVGVVGSAWAGAGGTATSKLLHRSSAAAAMLSMMGASISGHGGASASSFNGNGTTGSGHGHPMTTVGFGTSPSGSVSTSPMRRQNSAHGSSAVFFATTTDSGAGSPSTPQMTPAAGGANTTVSAILRSRNSVFGGVVGGGVSPAIRLRQQIAAQHYNAIGGGFGGNASVASSTYVAPAPNAGRRATNGPTTTNTTAVSSSSPAMPLPSYAKIDTSTARRRSASFEGHSYGSGNDDENDSEDYDTDDDDDDGLEDAAHQYSNSATGVIDDEGGDEAFEMNYDAYGGKTYDGDEVHSILRGTETNAARLLGSERLRRATAAAALGQRGELENRDTIVKITFFDGQKTAAVAAAVAAKQQQLVGGILARHGTTASAASVGFGGGGDFSSQASNSMVRLASLNATTPMVTSQPMTPQSAGEALTSCSPPPAAALGGSLFGLRSGGGGAGIRASSTCCGNSSLPVVTVTDPPAASLLSTEALRNAKLGSKMPPFSIVILFIDASKGKTVALAEAAAAIAEEPTASHILCILSKAEGTQTESDSKIPSRVARMGKQFRRFSVWDSLATKHGRPMIAAAAASQNSTATVGASSLASRNQTEWPSSPPMAGGENTDGVADELTYEDFDDFAGKLNAYSAVVDARDCHRALVANFITAVLADEGRLRGRIQRRAFTELEPSKAMALKDSIYNALIEEPRDGHPSAITNAKGDASSASGKHAAPVGPLLPFSNLPPRASQGMSSHEPSSLLLISSSTANTSVLSPARALQPLISGDSAATDAETPQKQRQLSDTYGTAFKAPYAYGASSNNANNTITGGNNNNNNNSPRRRSTVTFSGDQPPPSPTDLHQRSGGAASSSGHLVSGTPSSANVSIAETARLVAAAGGSALYYQPPPSASALRQLFTELDTDQDGLVSGTEVRTLYNAFDRSQLGSFKGALVAVLERGGRPVEARLLIEANASEAGQRQERRRAILEGDGEMVGDDGVENDGAGVASSGFNHETDDAGAQRFGEGSLRAPNASASFVAASADVLSTSFSSASVSVSSPTNANTTSSTAAVESQSAASRARGIALMGAKGVLLDRDIGSATSVTGSSQSKQAALQQLPSTAILAASDDKKRREAALKAEIDTGFESEFEKMLHQSAAALLAAKTSPPAGTNLPSASPPTGSGQPLVLAPLSATAAAADGALQKSSPDAPHGSGTDHLSSPAASSSARGAAHLRIVSQLSLQRSAAVGGLRKAPRRIGASASYPSSPLYAADGGGGIDGAAAGSAVRISAASASGRRKDDHWVMVLSKIRLSFDEFAAVMMSVAKM